MTTHTKKLSIIDGVYLGAKDRASLFDLHIPPAFNGQLIIFIHGFMGFKDWGAWHLVQDYFTTNGFAFCKFNLSHNGGTVENGIDFPDEVAFASNTYSNEVKDTECLVQKITPYFDEKPAIHLIGHSRGGGIALLSATSIKARSICLWAAISSISKRFPTDDALKKWQSDGVRHINNARTKQSLPQYFGLFEDFLLHEKALDIEQAALSLNRPAAVFHGMDDQTVLLEEGISLAKWLNVKLVTLENTDHVFGAKHPWLKQELPKALKHICDLSCLFIIKN